MRLASPQAFSAELPRQGPSPCWRGPFAPSQQRPFPQIDALRFGANRWARLRFSGLLPRTRQRAPAGRCPARGWTDFHPQRLSRSGDWEMSRRPHFAGTMLFGDRRQTPGHCAEFLACSYASPGNWALGRLRSWFASNTERISIWKPLDLGRIKRGHGVRIIEPDIFIELLRQIGLKVVTGAFS